MNVTNINSLPSITDLVIIFVKKTSFSEKMLKKLFFVLVLVILCCSGKVGTAKTAIRSTGNISSGSTTTYQANPVYKAS